jgi:2-phospho-L-lactate guanylyltransferase
MRVVVPFDATSPKSRLGSLLDPTERDAFARVMLDDVCSAIETAGGDPVVLASAPIDSDRPVVVDDQPLTDAVNDALDRAFAAGEALNPADEGGNDTESVDELAVVMADLALATPAALERLFAAESEVVLVPGRGGGTNAFVTRTPDFRVDYHDGSIRDHRANAAAVTDSVAELDSFRLATDVDDPGDVVEVLLHGEGEAAAWLREAGFTVTASGGRVEVERE